MLPAGAYGSRWARSPLCSIEPDRERAVVHQLHLHHGPEPTRRDADAQAPKRLREPEVERLGELRRRGPGEPWAPTAPRIRIERELAHDEPVAADVEERQVRPPVRVVEDPELGDASSERVGRRLVVLQTNPEQDDEPAPDLANGLAADAHSGAGSALEKCPHSLSRRRLGPAMLPGVLVAPALSFGLVAVPGVRMALGDELLDGRGNH